MEVETLEQVHDAADAVAASGNTLAFTVFASGLPLDRIPFNENMAGIPIAVIPASFGTFRKLEKRIEIMRKLDLTIFLPSDAANMTGARILSSVGIATTVMIGSQAGDLEPLIDLAAYALLGPAPHAPIEPFEYIACEYEPSKPVGWEFLLLENPAVPKAIDPLCRDCAAWPLCHSRFAASLDPAACSGFFHELIGLIEARRRKDSNSGVKPQRELALRRHDDPIRHTEDENVPCDPDIFVKSVPWINATGTAGDALLLSSVLKQVANANPRRRFNLVTRNHFGNILAGHPAINVSGYPPKDAAILTIGPASYQALARRFGLQIPTDEIFYVPWEFEDDPIICGMIRRGMRNIVIVRDVAAAGCLQQKDLQSLVGRLADRDIHAVQAGSPDDSPIRGTYSVRGLLTLRQLISFPRHFNAVVTNQDLMVYAARLCGVPCIDLRDILHADDLLPNITQVLK